MMAARSGKAVKEEGRVHQERGKMVKNVVGVILSLHGNY